MKRGKDEIISKTGGYTRQKEQSQTRDTDSSDSDDIEITISVPISKRRDIDSREKSSKLEKSTPQNGIASSPMNDKSTEKAAEVVSTSSSRDEDLKSLIRSRLSKASGYRANPS